MTSDRLYDFVFKGLLTEEALDRAGRRSKNLSQLADIEIAEALSIDLLDDDLIANAKAMAIVYAATAAFENSVRGLIKNILLESVGENWWVTSVSGKIRKRAEIRRDEEKKVKWHAQRGDDPIYYTTLGDLGNIIRGNFSKFEPYIQSAEWAASVFDVVERSRNVIMHSGMLGREDIERLGINIRDWIKQVGA
jgi:energy-converting hydrogenase A subunit M